MVSLPDHLMPIEVGRERLPREELSAKQRERILPAAIEVFAKRGYPATTVDHIVAATGSGVGRFYELFDGKDGCFLAAYDRILAQARSQLEEAVPPDGDWPQQVIAAIRALLEFVSAHPMEAKLALIEAPTAGAVARGRYDALLEAAAAKLEEGRECASSQAPPPPGLGYAVAAGLAWLIHNRLSFDEAERIEALLPEAIEIALGPYLGEPEARSLAAAA